MTGNENGKVGCWATSCSCYWLWEASCWLWMLIFLNNYFNIFSILILVTVPRLLWTSLYCQIAVQRSLWLVKCLSLNLNFSFLNWFRYFSYQVATQLSSWGWVDPVPDPILPEKFLWYSRESNPGPLGWQSGVLTTIPNRWSSRGMEFLQVNYESVDCDLTQRFLFMV